MDPRAGLAIATAALALGGAARADPVVVAADWFSCSSGKYALTLPKHYPTLRKIGKHRIVDGEVRIRDGVTITARTIEYTGLRLELLVSSSDPNRYELRSVESNSRRWNIGQLSVGTSPWWWPWSREKSLTGVRLKGELKFVGATDSVVLLLDDGRVVSVRYSCRGGVRP